ncbi:acyltransferase family protein [Pedobacter sp.]|jgi:hypothetical protein|uniref:acyltransferase family protein n=1 Tax=Pedobacter sp. TaxID=1411316 RepID=UPI002BF4B9C2|nr:acyltransferase family protein [Pedobacter sp.]HWW43340.1 acyltransferase family protein [Pedobacter sp.]
MSAGSPNKPTTNNYKFIDSIRFISMMCIVMEHSSPLLGLRFPNFKDQMVQTLALQFEKSGTIIFFILAGFLIGDKFMVYSTKTYLSRRLKTTFKPWLFWLLIFLSLLCTDQFVRFFKFGNRDMIDHPVLFLLEKLDFIVTQTSFWFIINFMFCITFLLLFRKYLYTITYGIILALLSLFYSVNLYFEWIPTTHTIALFGFIFYLWLGVMLHKYFQSFCSWAEKQSFGISAVAVLITFALACMESLNLIKLGSMDAFNTLRLTNIIFSLACFVFLFKFCNFDWIEDLNPRATTFGIHLIHHILIIVVIPLIYKPLHIGFTDKPVLYLAAFQFITFIIIYPTSYLTAYLIGKTKNWKWTVGQ